MTLTSFSHSFYERNAEDSLPPIVHVGSGDDKKVWHLPEKLLKSKSTFFTAARSISPLSGKRLLYPSLTNLLGSLNSPIKYLVEISQCMFCRLSRRIILASVWNSALQVPGWTLNANFEVC